MDFLTVTDLEPFAEIGITKATAMIADATSIAMLVAPCLSGDDLTNEQILAVRAVLRGAVLRWNDAGTGVRQQQSVGSYSETIDTTHRRSLFWPSEIDQLQQICRGDESGSAFMIDTVPSASVTHAEICAINLGATYCSCGASLTLGGPLWETGESDL